MKEVTIAPRLWENPRELFDDISRVRAQDGLPWDNHFEAHVVSRYEDIIDVLDRPDVFSSKPTIPEFPPPVRSIFEGKVPDKSTLLNWDNPDHDRLRKSVASFFVPRRLARFEPQIRKVANGLIDGFVRDGQVEIKDRFALPLPLNLIAMVAGLDPEKWQWIGQSLALFGGHKAMRTGTIEEQIQGILDLHAYVAQLIQDRKTDRRDDLISHIWNERDAGNVVMTDMEHLAMIPGLLLAGHETTTNLLTMSVSHLLHYGLWSEATKDRESIDRAREELTRFESAITGMRRESTVDTSIGGCPVKAGTQLFVMYNSGSRDPSQFAEPDVIKLDRKSQTQHLGFGRGIHACLGAPLARLLVGIELEVLAERLPGLRLVSQYDEIEYEEVSAGRGINQVLISWDLTRIRAVDTNDQGVAAVGTVEIGDIDLRVSEVDRVAEKVVRLTLAPNTIKALPRWEPGAHIDIHLGNLGWRQYSLCSTSCTPDSWQVAVLLEDLGRGGSRYIHEHYRKGIPVTAKGPRNHFKMLPSPRYLFIAGGIGITPLIPMIHAAKAAGSEYRLIYLGKSRRDMAFVDQLEADSAVCIWPKDEKGRLDLSELVQGDLSQLKMYCCGPERLLQGVEEACSDLPPGTLTVERFAALDTSNLEKKAFDVQLIRSGRTLHVPADKSLLEVLNANGTSVMSTCTAGTCGTCEVKVVHGIPEHRDTVLTQLEKLEGNSMMACVSRCQQGPLGLDLW